MEWKLEVLSEATRTALDELSSAGWLTKHGWYLAGGTALAMQAGHRQSLDLDFFTDQKTFTPNEVIMYLSAESWRSEIVQTGTIYGTMKGTKVSFIAYPFFRPVLAKHNYGQVDVLDKDDIAVMKVVAISQRGKKRDFVDLYWYANNIAPLDEVIKKLPRQYPEVAHDYHHIIKSLTYFEDAEIDVMPTLFFDASWDEIKKYFESEVPKIAKQVIGL